MAMSTRYTAQANTGCTRAGVPAPYNEVVPQLLPVPPPKRETRKKAMSAVLTPRGMVPKRALNPVDLQSLETLWICSLKKASNRVERQDMVGVSSSIVSSSRNGISPLMYGTVFPSPVLTSS